MWCIPKSENQVSSGYAGIIPLSGLYLQGDSSYPVGSRNAKIYVIWFERAPEIFQIHLEACYILV